MMANSSCIRARNMIQTCIKILTSKIHALEAKWAHKVIVWQTKESNQIKSVKNFKIWWISWQIVSHLAIWLPNIHAKIKLKTRIKIAHIYLWTVFIIDFKTLKPFSSGAFFRMFALCLWGLKGVFWSRMEKKKEKPPWWF